MELLSAIIWAVGSAAAFYNAVKDGVAPIWLIIGVIFVFNAVKQARKYWNTRNIER